MEIMSDLIKTSPYKAIKTEVEVTTYYTRGHKKSWCFMDDLFLPNCTW